MEFNKTLCFQGQGVEGDPPHPKAFLHH